MRTITFEVEVDDKIFDTIVPSIYDDAVKNAPDGRLFLCADKTSVGKKIVRLHCDVTAEGGKEAPWFDDCYLPDEIRIVKDSKGIVANGKSAAELVAESDAELQEDSVNEKLDAIFRELHSLGCGVKLLGEVHNNAHAAVLDHFKQIHEQENWLQEHQNRAEDRLMNHIQECCDKATLTTKTYCHDILHALPELEDRIKECVGKPDTAQPSTAGNAPSGESSNQVLLRALDLLATAIKK